MTKPLLFICALSLSAQSTIPQAYLVAANRFPSKPVALVFPLAPPDCKTLAQTTRQISGFGLAAILLHPQPQSPCPDVPSAVAAPPAHRGNDAWTLVLLAPDRRTSLTLHFRGIQDLAQAALDWDAGRQAFSAHCGHCHGDDGADTSYANIKSLAGVSRRLPSAKIVEGGQSFGAVDLASWPKRDVDRLLLFISGL